MTWKEYRDVVQLCMDGVRKTKACLELDSVRDTKGNKNGFQRYITSKRKSRENTDMMQVILFSY